MQISDFLSIIGFYEMEETEKAKHLAYFYRKISNIKEFGRSELETWFDQVGLSPNISRLFTKIKSKPWSKSNKSGLLEIHGKHLANLELTHPLDTESKVVSCVGEVLPKDIYKDVNRKYIKHIANQANWAYECGAYDACAVMMRRLLEILLIHMFRNNGAEQTIKKANGHYDELDIIINKAIATKSLGLTQGTIKELKTCKDLGNLGAHEIVYTCKKSDIDSIILGYRKAISHLIDYAGFGT
ncbi:DUF4145 domain-containing protein [Sneathiella sp. CAU 1612]|uniref:DUF4145 domain-containing protein n=1 Tax=Sneathiella sedimenti TaxID=2816034 RepID=A0ABS3F4X0_9PROT|nr:DUF4145 domain-containing protein [Sneathiella sedimenti]MBO0333574.1 DUF4145 domain-containing protein [Sneathiella sedimenti]